MNKGKECQASKRWRIGHLPVCLLGVFALYGITACINDNLDDCPAPYGLVRVSTTWTPRSEGLDVPPSYTFRTEEHSESGLSTATEPNLISHDFRFGAYYVYLYNVVDGITMDGTTARVGVKDSLVNPTPGWLFSYAGYLMVTEDTITDLVARMKQQVRLLTIEMTPKGDAAGLLRSIDITLNGIAAELHINDDSTDRTSVVAFHLTPFPDKTWQASARLLGMTAGEHLLILTAGVLDGSENIIELTDQVDVGHLLTGFNSNKEYPITLKGELHLTTDPNDPLLIIATITDWQVVYGSPIIAE
jgi:hypothetical protein